MGCTWSAANDANSSVCVRQLVSLLLELEQLIVCRGSRVRSPACWLQVRSPTCHLLVAPPCVTCLPCLLQDEEEETEVEEDDDEGGDELREDELSASLWRLAWTPWVTTLSCSTFSKKRSASIFSTCCWRNENLTDRKSPDRKSPEQVKTAKSHPLFFRNLYRKAKGASYRS